MFSWEYEFFLYKPFHEKTGLVRRVFNPYIRMQLIWGFMIGVTVIVHS